jgi:hypothetical protein
MAKSLVKPSVIWSDFTYKIGPWYIQNIVRVSKLRRLGRKGVKRGRFGEPKWEFGPWTQEWASQNRFWLVPESEEW